MRGYFAVGAEEMSKPMNFGAMLRTAHAFGASFAFMVRPFWRLREAYRADTSHSAAHIPLFEFADARAVALPKGCRLIGVELVDEAIDLPRFQHPLAAAYVFGREKGSLSADMLARCHRVVKIPTRFSLNVSVAAALVMYDRMLALGGFGERALGAEMAAGMAAAGAVPRAYRADIGLEEPDDPPAEDENG